MRELQVLGDADGRAAAPFGRRRRRIPHELWRRGCPAWSFRGERLDLA